MGDIKKAIKDSTKYNKGDPIVTFNLNYDAPTSSLESIYFWILDFLNGFTKDIKKVTDNFQSSPGSGHFAEMGQRATRMQEEGMKIFGLMNQVVKAMINLIYDLKEFEIRLKHYEDANSKDKQISEAGNLALKQIWLDQVDVKRGRGSIHQMTYELGFSTLRDAFMVANKLSDIDDMAKNQEVINEQVKRILIPRLSEYLKWKEYSEKELRKRFEVEINYLKSEVESLKLYTSWVRPYLKAAEDLKMKGFDNNPALVSAFNTTMFELVLFGKDKMNFEKAVKSKRFPKGWEGKKLKRDYHSCWVVTFKFRGFPQRIDQRGDYAFGGKIEMIFDAYALNDEELELVNKNLGKQDVEDGLKLIQSTTDAMNAIKEDIDHFLGELKPVKKEEKAKEEENPFKALWNIFKFKKEEKKEDKDKKKIQDIKDIKKDNFIEEIVRENVADSAKSTLYTIYDVYKKAHGMASSPEKFDF